MTYFRWTNELDVMVDEMNDQHQVLISIMNDLFQLNERGVSKYKILRKLNELVSYTRKHFRDEEAYMESIKFTGRKNHKIIHERLLHELNSYVEEFKANHETLTEKLFNFLNNWLLTHIEHTDNKYGLASWERSQYPAAGM